MNHSKQAVLYAFSIGFEKASYYGIRAVLILFMIGEALNFSRTEALGVYGILVTSIIVSKVIGGLLGDLLFGNKKTLVFGGILQIIGCLLFCFHSLNMLYIGIAVFALGNGLLNPNIIAQFGKQYLNKPKLLDAGFTGLYFMMNIGSGIGILVIGLLAESNFNYGFILGGFFAGLSVILAYLAKDGSNILFEFNVDGKLLKKIFYVLLVIFLSGVFSLVYDTCYSTTMILINAATLKFRGDYLMSLSIGSAFGVVFTIVWTYYYTNQFFKFFIGFLLCIASILLLFLVPENSTDPVLSIIIASSLLLAIGETLIAPMLYSVIAKYSNPKYLAIIISIASIPLMLFNKVAGVFGEKSVDLGINTTYTIIIVVSFLFALIALLIGLFNKKEEAQGSIKKLV